MGLPRGSEIIRENYPLIVRVNFFIEDYIDNIYEKGYFFQSLFFPLMLVGVLFWSFYFAYEVETI